MAHKFYVTTPIFYVNAAPHMGHAVAFTIADTLARAHRLIGDDTYFLTGTDEHGGKIARAAEHANKTPQAFADEMSGLFRSLATEIGGSHDQFIRTSDTVVHQPGAIALWEALTASRDMYRAEYEGLYCVGCEAFVTEHELVDGKCPLHDQAPEHLKEENYFFRLSEYIEKIRALITSDEIRILPPERKNEVLAMIDAGVSDVSFSRPAKDVSWGIPVPNDPSQTMYVWCDALANYISALGYRGGDEPAQNMSRFWPADVHVLGKDILRFHAILWPGILLAAGLPLPKTILVHGFLNSGGRKMSKTLGNIIDPVEALHKHGADVLRNFLIAEVPTFSDGDFTLDRFEDLYEARFVNGVGNLTSRIATMIEKYADGVLARPTDEMLATVRLTRTIGTVEGGELVASGEDPASYVRDVLGVEWKTALDGGNVQLLARAGWSACDLADQYIQEYKPFSLFATEPDRARAVVWNAAMLLLGGMELLSPVIPETFAKVRRVFGLSEAGAVDLTTLAELKAKRPEPMFPRVSAEKFEAQNTKSETSTNDKNSKQNEA